MKVWCSCAIAFVLIFIFASASYAADIDSIEVGERYMLEKLLSDQEIVVAQVDRSRGLVKVRFDDGSEEWVHPDRLLNHMESYAKDAKDGFELGYKGAELAHELLTAAFEDKEEDKLPFAVDPVQDNPFDNNDSAPDGYNGCFVNLSNESLTIEYYFVKKVLNKDTYEYVALAEMQRFTAIPKEVYEVRLLEDEYMSNSIIWKVHGSESNKVFKANRVFKFGEELNCLTSTLDKEKIIVFNEGSHDTLGNCRKYHEVCEKLWSRFK
jgi:hypothetical protein